MVDRREILKLASLGALGAAGVTAGLQRANAQQTSKPNILVILFDTLSAQHMELYGYARGTMPNLTRFAQNSIVYHDHKAAGNFTVPSTGSLLTGTYPWTHRAFFGPPIGQARDESLFRWLPPEYLRIAYTQNALANLFLQLYRPDIDLHVRVDEHDRLSSPALKFVHSFPGQDDLLKSISAEGFYFSNRNRAGSLFGSVADRLMVQGLAKVDQRRHVADYPIRMPSIWLHNGFFTQEQLFDGLYELVAGLSSPYFAYLHLWSPHEPYRPGAEYFSRFKDDYEPRRKRLHHFGHPSLTPPVQLENRRLYDAAIRHVDEEFGRLITRLEADGALENTYVIVTSDHGQLFERGVHGHVTPLMYEGLLHIPLIVRPPGQASRIDVHYPTSNVDLAPTILELAGRSSPPGIEGLFLPYLGGRTQAYRSIFSMESRNTPAFRPMQEATLVHQKGPRKLIQYQGYADFADQIEYYDLTQDPEERRNLAPDHPNAADDLIAELSQELKRANAPFIPSNNT